VEHQGGALRGSRHSPHGKRAWERGKKIKKKYFLNLTASKGEGGGLSGRNGEIHFFVSKYRRRGIESDGLLGA